MKSTLPPAQRFTWRRLIAILLTQLAVFVALEFYLRWQSGRWEATSLVPIPVVLWVYATFVYRWLKIMKELANGSFSEETYLADPIAYIMGNSKQRRLVITVAVLIGLICLIVIEMRGWG
jgi:hypothetical protein